MSFTNLLQEAKILFASGQLDKSIEQFNRAEHEGCDSIDLYLSRAAAFIALGKYEQAEKDLDVVIQEDKENERAYYFRGIARIAMQKFEAGANDLTQSLVRNHDRGIAHLLRGLAYSELGNQKDAVLDFNSASAFSKAELNSFKQLFGNDAHIFEKSQALLSETNAPWKNLMSKETAERLRGLLR